MIRGMLKNMPKKVISTFSTSCSLLTQSTLTDKFSGNLVEILSILLFIVRSKHIAVI